MTLVSFSKIVNKSQILSKVLPTKRDELFCTLQQLLLSGYIQLNIILASETEGNDKPEVSAIT